MNKAEGRKQEAPLVLFVCSANVCRSPMAEFLLRDWLGKGASWQVASAGVAAADGEPASDEAITVMAEKGLDLRAHRSRRLTAGLVDAARIIVVMTRYHLAVVRQLYPRTEGRVFLLNSFGLENPGGDVEDPVGGTVATYRKTRNAMNAVMPDLVLYLHGLDADPAGEGTR